MSHLSRRSSATEQTSLSIGLRLLPKEASRAGLLLGLAKETAGGWLCAERSTGLSASEWSGLGLLLSIVGAYGSRGGSRCEPSLPLTHCKLGLVVLHSPKEKLLLPPAVLLLPPKPPKVPVAGRAPNGLAAGCCCAC